MEYNIGRTEEITIYSNALQEELTLLVYKPSNYSSLYKYHLVIAQDGQDYFNLGRIARVTEELIQEKRIPNTIIVGIPYGNVRDRKDKYHPDGSQKDAYIRFLAHELVPYLDDQYPTYQMGRGRVLIGDSLGATISLLAGLQYPHTFGKIALQSPYVDETVLTKVENFPSPHLLQLYHTFGTKEVDVKTTDGTIKDFVTPNRSLAELIKNKSYEALLNQFEGDHTWTYWQPDLKNALHYILND
ncbi:enterochelin esterase-like enzyme [Bacillus mesophilus]|uniref:Esterase family protein n=1 Tax=Bacillus mesophilus TaxID=1808955 RepID=A0A6M0Q348_9BACI|nr:enterochelin esterase-like enzyme [Bacillus mesophilus]NEY70563.1 esterase family protein [Bacillus mesophilus]